MAGPRPTHLARRGAVYLVRFRLPTDLAKSLGMVDLRRSLYTSDPALARRRQSAARVWFEDLVEQLRAMSSPTREDLERAAAAYFGHLAAKDDVPNRYRRDDYEQGRDYDVALAQDGLVTLDSELVTNDFEHGRRHGAEVARFAGGELADLPPELKLAAQQFGTRAAREATRYFIHRVTTPHRQFVAEDALFVQPPSALATPQSAAPLSGDGIKLSVAGARYLERKRQMGVGKSHIDELERAIGWLGDVVGSDARLSMITPEVMRQFRDDLPRLRSEQGTKQRFQDKLTDAKGGRISWATYTRYWRTVQGFFAWAHDEQLIAANPAALAALPKPKEVEVATPEPFSSAELRTIFSQPLYAGYRSLQRPNLPGDLRIRDGRWWSGVLLLHTGMRAGELAQLLPSDFVFDHEFPHLKVRREDGEGNKVKSVKTKSSVRDVPLHPDLLTLGLAEFVGRRAAKHPKGRVFSEFRLGNGRSSEGLTRFWGDLLRRAKVRSKGRATHVWRHSLVAFLRAGDVAAEDIAAIVGHVAADGALQTAKYGGAYPLVRKAKSLTKLNLGFDLVGLLGGPYNPKQHRAP